MGEGGTGRSAARQGEEAAEGEASSEEGREQAGEESHQARESAGHGDQKGAGAKGRQAQGLRIIPWQWSGQPAVLGHEDAGAVGKDTPVGNSEHELAAPDQSHRDLVAHGPGLWCDGACDLDLADADGAAFAW